MAFRPSPALLFRNPNPLSSFCPTSLPQKGTPKGNRYRVHTSSKPDEGNNGGPGGQSSNGKKHSTSELFDNVKLGGRFPKAEWLVYGCTFLACLDYFGLIELPPLIEIQFPQEPEEPKNSGDETDTQ
ncbi:hypothetical protein PG996_007228 [Apiospora saccharicola]|uniref:Uncharacterized protein n=1 Tax=Apiospora saccharicola TaxID=335842 RepID=A0ABR1VA84_9PEZI